MADNRSLGEKLQSLPKNLLYLVLIIVCSVPLLFPNITVPNKPFPYTEDLFKELTALPAGSTVLISSDWTQSTRGESGGQFEALIRILMRKEIKFAVYTSADPQAPQVARDVINRIHEQEVAEGRKGAKRWNDWLILGFFPNAEATSNLLANDFRRAMAGREDVDPEGRKRAVLESPVLQDVKSFTDLKMVVVVTASKTSTIAIQRMYGKGVPLAMMVTGVMGPETLVYYASKQIVGLSAGLKGVYDLEGLMNEEFPGMTNFGKGKAYYPTLHAALFLLILAVIVGNVGMALSRKKTR